MKLIENKEKINSRLEELHDKCIFVSLTHRLVGEDNSDEQTENNVFGFNVNEENCYLEFEDCDVVNMLTIIGMCFNTIKEFVDDNPDCGFRTILCVVKGDRQLTIDADVTDELYKNMLKNVEGDAKYHLAETLTSEFVRNLIHSVMN